MSAKKASEQSTRESPPWPYCPFANKNCTLHSCPVEKKSENPPPKNGSFRFILLVMGLLAIMLIPRVLRDPSFPLRGSSTISKAARPAPTTISDRLRIATWNLDPLDYKKVSDPEQCRQIASIVSQFDLIALGGLRTRNETVEEALLAELGRQGTHYAAASLPMVGLHGSQSLFLYRPDHIGLDRSTLFHIVIPNSPSPPFLCGSFRAMTTDPDRAFTFTLVHLGTSTRDELPAAGSLRQVWEQVTARAGREGHAEDDILLLGCFGSTPYEWGDLISVHGLATAHTDVATSMTGFPCNNMVFNERATTEYTGRFGVLSPLEIFQLSPSAAKALAPCDPFWLEFTACETLYSGSSYQRGDELLDFNESPPIIE